MTATKNTFYFLVGGALLLAAPYCTRTPAESNKGSLIFPHAAHVEQGECSECHEGVEKENGTPQGKFLPQKSVCGNCHEEELKNRCDMCHQSAKTGIRFVQRDRRITFSHAKHMAKGALCTTCHDAKRHGAASLVQGHSSCNTAGCHAADYKALACNKCHLDLERYGRKPTADLSHGAGFAKAVAPSRVSQSAHARSATTRPTAPHAMDEPSQETPPSSSPSR